MAFTFSLFTNWSVGVLNGFKQKDNVLPNGIKYGTMGVSTFASMLRAFGNFDTPQFAKYTAGQKLGALLFGIPLLMATNFCIGHHFGKALRYSAENPTDVKINLI